MISPTSTLAQALVAAQAQFKAAHMGGTNPHFKSKYARFSDVHDACVPVLNANGIAVIQSGEGSDDAGIQISTTFLHVSGEKLVTAVRVPLSGGNAQAAGSAITYARRYGLAMACGLVNDEDDDGNQASAKPATKPAKAKKPIKERSDAELASLAQWAAKEGKGDLLDQIAEEQERRRASHQTPEGV